MNLLFVKSILRLVIKSIFSAFSSDCEGEGGISGLSLKMKKAGIQKTIFKINSERI